MRNDIEKSFSNCLFWILIKSNVVETDDAKRMERMAVDEREYLFKARGRRCVYIELPLWSPGYPRFVISINEDFVLRETIGRVEPEEN
jgi:hypothetical protein